MYSVFLDGEIASPPFTTVGEASTFRNKLIDLMPDILVQRFTVDTTKNLLEAEYTAGYDDGHNELCDEHQDEIRDLELQVDDLEEKLSDLRSQLIGRDLEIDHLIANLKTETDRRELAEHLADLQTHSIQSLQDEIERLHQAEPQ